MTKIILDTDIGSDIDDAVALATALKSDKIDLVGVTTVYGNTKLRSRLAKKMIKLAEQEDVKVYSGVDLPLLRKRPVWMVGNEGDGVLDEEEQLEIEEQHAVDFIIETIMQNPQEIVLVPVGPLTNIALAIMKEPKIIDNVKEIVLMGGVTRLGSKCLEIKDLYTEHNITSDPEAAAVVFESGIKITMVGLDVTQQVKITKKEMKMLSESNDKVNQMITVMLENWLEFIKEDFTLMHDPLTVALLIDESYVEKTKMDIKLQYSQEHPSGQTIGIVKDDGAVDVCLEVDSERFVSELMNLLIN